MPKKELVWELLSDSRFYCRTVQTVLTEVGIDLGYLKEICQELSKEKEDPITFFHFDGVDYLGTRSGKTRYDNDAMLGVNSFEVKNA